MNAAAVRNPLVLGALAAVIAIAAYWMLILSPKREEAAALGTEISSVQQQLVEAQSQLATFRKAKDSYKANYATVARLGKAVPEDDDIRSLMVQVESAAEDTGVDFRTIQIGQTTGGTAATPTDASSGQVPPPGATVGEAGFMTMPFSFKFRGKFFNLSKFMTQLERFVAVRNDALDVTGRLLVLESLTLEPGQEGFPNIDAQIGATTYLLPPTQGLTGGATPDAPAGASATSTEGSALTPTTDGTK